MPRAVVQVHPSFATLSDKKAPGKVCRVCNERKPYEAFAGGKRTCLACKAAGAQRFFERVCTVCSTTFQSPSQKAKYCSEPCFKAGVNETRRSRYREKAEG